MLYYLPFAKEMKETVGGRNTVLRVLRLTAMKVIKSYEINNVQNMY